MISFMDKLSFFRRIVERVGEERMSKRRREQEDRSALLKANLENEIRETRERRQRKQAKLNLKMAEKLERGAGEEARRERLALRGALAADFLSALTLRLRTFLKDEAYLDFVDKNLKSEDGKMLAGRASADLAEKARQRWGIDFEVDEKMEGLQILMEDDVLMNFTLSALMERCRMPAAILLEECLGVEQAVAVPRGGGRVDPAEEISGEASAVNEGSVAAAPPSKELKENA